jgi:hypothetical protein
MATTTTTTIQTLDELDKAQLRYILSFLCPKDVRQLTFVSKYFNRKFKQYVLWNFKDNLKRRFSEMGMPRLMEFLECLLGRVLFAITGSMPLSVILGERWENQDVDILFRSWDLSVISMEDVQVYLDDALEMYPEFKSLEVVYEMYEDYIGQHENKVNSGLIRFYKRNPTEGGERIKVIDLIKVSRCIETSVKLFDFSGCKCRYYGGGMLMIPDVRYTMDKIHWVHESRADDYIKWYAGSRDPRRMDERALERMKKYKDRGFRFSFPGRSRYCAKLKDGD